MGLFIFHAVVCHAVASVTSLLLWGLGGKNTQDYVKIMKKWVCVCFSQVRVVLQQIRSVPHPSRDPHLFVVSLV